MRIRADRQTGRTPSRPIDPGKDRLRERAKERRQDRPRKVARYRHALTGRRSPGASAPCFHKRCYSRVADTTQIGSANLPASKARGPISHPSAIAKTPICFSPYLYRAQLSVLKVCVSSADGEVRAGRGARLRRQEAFEEIFCLDHWVCCRRANL